MSTYLMPQQGSHLAPAFEHATVADAMCHGVISCEPDAPATDVARIMATRHLHAVVVAGLERRPGEGERLLWRVITDSDLLRAARSGLEGRTAADLGAAEPTTVATTTTLDEAARIMVESGQTHLIVADRGRPVGVLSTLDVAGVLAWGRA
ncbi:CBS domain-containing protein [Baekduia soli]|uniref:CBS domain-containing protein n=1 Tax=Baekduia soli TaxID=496014 RepID=A0A5B8U7C5_9ACTN|nr:CBS domain-containing protein [Baekduia soli]QEC48728.1 CBS domain-containing protein [Baekduia soli]